MGEGRYHTTMKRRRMGATLCVITLLAFMPGPTIAQEAPVGWEMGLVDDADYKDNGLFPEPIDEDGTKTIRFWIRNDYLVGDIEISLEYDISISTHNDPNTGSPDWTGCFSGEESVTVGSGANDTFSFELCEVSVGDMLGARTEDFEIEGVLTSLNGVPMLPGGNENIEGELLIPKIARWGVEIEELGHPVNAGTEFNLHVNLINEGNWKDAIGSISVEDNCPVLTFDDAQLDAIEGQEMEWRQNTPHIIEVTLVFDASSTHPSRLCEIEITVESANYGTSWCTEGGNCEVIGDARNSGDIEVGIEARPVGAQQDQDDASTDDDDGPQNQDQVTSDNFLMFPTLVTPMAILWAALLRAREE